MFYVTLRFYVYIMYKKRKENPTFIATVFVQIYADF